MILKVWPVSLLEFLRQFRGSEKLILTLFAFYFTDLLFVLMFEMKQWVKLGVLAHINLAAPNSSSSLYILAVKKKEPVSLKNILGEIIHITSFIKSWLFIFCVGKWEVYLIAFLMETNTVSRKNFFVRISSWTSSLKIIFTWKNDRYMVINTWMFDRCTAKANEVSLSLQGKQSICCK